MATKILLCNIIIRRYPDAFPPIACTGIINYLNANGYEAKFYDIDQKRPSDKEIMEYFSKEHFDLVGISAVVSTGYAFTKKLAGLIKKVSPSTRIIVGGNMAAAYEVLLRKCEIDLCGIGEGEKVMVSIVKYLDKHKSFSPVTEELKSIKGIAFLGEDGNVVYTGTGDLVDKSELSEPDYQLLEEHSDIGFYIQDPLVRSDFSKCPRSYETSRKGKKMATLLTAKGCVNTCTFCHRWIKGYRVFPVSKIIGAIKRLKEKYNVGFIVFNDECFGEDIRWLQEFIAQITLLDILFVLAGVRVGLVKKDQTCMRRLKEAGMVAIYFGMESGCDKILSVMEKRATTEDNIRAAQVCAQEGLYTEVQLVVGMPGENDETIKDTIAFVIKATSKNDRPPMLSVNYLQSLPGTPSYDFLLYHGLVGKDVDAQERYLLFVSDVNAAEFSQYINVTESPLTHVMIWQRKIHVYARIAWLKEHQWRITKENIEEMYGKNDLPFFSIAHLKLFLKSSPWAYWIIDLLGETFWNSLIIYKTFRVYGMRKAILILFGVSKEDRSMYRMSNKSLKKVMVDLAPVDASKGSPCQKEETVLVKS